MKWPLLEGLYDPVDIKAEDFHLSDLFVMYLSICNLSVMYYIIWKGIKNYLKTSTTYKPLLPAKLCLLLYDYCHSHINWNGTALVSVVLEMNS